MRRLNSRSIRFRLTVCYAGILAVTFACGSMLVFLALQHSITATADNVLHARLETVQGYVEQEASGEGATHLREELNEDAIVNSASSYLQIVDRGNVPIYVSPNAQNWPSQRLEGAERQIVFRTLRIGGRLFRVVTAPVSIGAVQIGLPLDEFQAIQTKFLWTAAAIGPLLLLVSMAAGYWMSGRVLSPVTKITSAAERITSANLSERLPYSGAGDELDRLSAVLNQTLAGLESAFTRMAQFTADASHELRTPLAVIRTTAELMRSRARSSEEHTRAWANVLAQAERTTELIDDLLTLARDDAGAGYLEFQPTDVAALAADAMAEMQVLALSKGIRLSCSASDEAVVSADAEALRRVFTILLDNAIKATKREDLIEVRVGKDESAATVEVEVKDTGVGIAPEDLPHIFDRFYRASKDRSRETGGAGLGLAIAQWIVAQHGGVIQVDSQLGCGSIFRLVLPAFPSAQPAFSDSSESATTLRL